MIKWLNRMNLSNKLVLMVYTSLVSIYVFMGILGFFYMESRARAEFSQSCYDLCINGNEMIDRECSYLKGISDYLSVSSLVQETLRRDARGEDLVSFASELANLKYAVSLIIYGLDGMPIDSMSIDYSSQPLPQSLQRGSVFSSVLEENARYVWEFIPQNSSRLFVKDNSPKLCLWQLIIDTHTTRPLGVLNISVDSRRLISMGATRQSPYFQLIQLAVQSGDVASNHSSYVLDQSTRQQLLNIVGDQQFGESTINYMGRRFLAYYARVSTGTLITFYLTPYQFPVQTIAVSAWGFYLLVLLVLTLMLVPLLTYAFRRITMPLHMLTRSVDGFARGNPDSSFDYRGDDEIGKLGRAFNDMVRTNQEFVKKTVALKVREREAQMHSLQAQINPHFLYNMLNIIYWKALRGGNGELADISYAMGQLFRMSLRGDNSLITLEKEYEICKYYLMLQKKRFGDHIEYEMHMDSGLENVYVPKLLLQPLVENAIVHGAEDHIEPVHIRMYAERCEDNIRLRVTNDGTVIVPEVLQLLTQKAIDGDNHQRAGNRYALRNIDERLNLLYGNTYRFDFESSEETGTIVTIIIPIAFPASKKGDDTHA